MHSWMLELQVWRLKPPQLLSQSRHKPRLFHTLFPSHLEQDPLLQAPCLFQRLQLLHPHPPHQHLNHRTRFLWLVLEQTLVEGTMGPHVALDVQPNSQQLRL